MQMNRVTTNYTETFETKECFTALAEMKIQGKREMKVERMQIECIIVWPEADENAIGCAVTRSQRVRFLPRTCR